MSPPHPQIHDAAPLSRLVAKLVRELVQGGPAASFADLTAALKDRLATLRILASTDDVNAAYRLVGSNRPLVPPPVRRLQRVERPAAGPAIGRAEAAAICQALGVAGLGRPMPAATPRSARARDRHRALQMVATALVATIERCEALEQALEAQRPEDGAP